MKIVHMPVYGIDSFGLCTKTFWLVAGKLSLYHKKTIFI